MEANIAKKPRVILVDPSRFTAPYDAELAEALASAGADVVCSVRPLREGEIEEFPARVASPMFYRSFDRPDFLPRILRKPAKALAHLMGLSRLVVASWRRPVDVVHFQWAVLPVFDALAMWILRRRCKVVITVHDTVPFNGQKISFLQNFGFDLPIRAADKVIVHTTAARDTLIARGTPPDKVDVVPHGPLTLNAAPPARPVGTEDDRFVFTLFGQLKPYKGIDVLIDAVAKVHRDIRRQARFIVAGGAFMDMEPIKSAVRERGLDGVVELQIGHQTEDQMAVLFDKTDCFIFPYRQIDASGVFFLTAALRKWMIASRIGVFADQIEEGVTGTLVPPADSNALARAITGTIEDEPKPSGVSILPSWQEIGLMTLNVYRAA